VTLSLRFEGSRSDPIVMISALNVNQHEFQWNIEIAVLSLCSITEHEN
jgi:hypothetical protein